jgi:2-octaprenylphenol hydroxylase
MEAKELKSMSKKFDIAIVGGGMVGLSMAAALSKNKLKILLLEKQDLSNIITSDLLENRPISNDEFNVRVSAISPGNRDFLSRLNAWQNIPQSRLASYDFMKVWDGDGSGKIEFSAAKIAQLDLGVIVENRVLQAALLKQIDEASNITCVFNDELELIDLSENENSKALKFALASGEQFQCKLLIGADGAKSQVRKMVDIKSDNLPYSQIAYVANVKTEYSHENTAWQRFTPNGPVAFLPLANEHLCSVVWSVDIERAEQLKLDQISTDEFVTNLQNAFESKLGKVSAVSKHFGFPLIKRHSNRYLSHRIALVGDAAHTIHPLAGQGVNLGFQDVASLSGSITELCDSGRDFGLVENLRSFERERKTANLVMQNAMSGFKHLFANQSMPVTLIRNFAMSALDNLPMAKEIIIKRAMGI